MGPPRLAASSKIFTVLFAVCSPRARNSSVRLALSMPLPLYVPLRMVLKVLPPSFGTTFITGPSALTSAEMPLVCSTISSTTAALTW